jgi:hypothetical protein
MSLWRKRNVKHNEQKHDNLSNPLDRLHEENVRLGLYEDAYDLSIKSDDLSIKSWIGLTEEEKIKLWNRAEKRQAYQGIPTFIALIQEVEAKLKEKNT